MKKIKKKQSLVIGLLLVMSAIICFNISPVSAQTRQIDSVVVYTSGTDTILNITVTHQSPYVSDGVYNPLDYVDRIELEIDGAYPYTVVNVGSIELIHFSVEYNMGELASACTVRARAMGLQGTGEWTEHISVIPEFSLIHLAPILMVISIAMLLIRSKITTKSKK